MKETPIRPKTVPPPRLRFFVAVAHFLAVLRLGLWLDFPVGIAGSNLSIPNPALQLATTDGGLDGESRPPNDDFHNAQLLPSVPSEIPAGSSTATFEPEEPDHPFGSSKGSLWFKWVAPTNGIFGAYTYNSSPRSIEIYRGEELAQLQRVALLIYDQARGAFTLNNFPAQKGETFHIAATEPFNPNQPLTPSYFEILPSPTNNRAESATVISGKSGRTPFKTLGATFEPNEPRSNNTNALGSLWFTFQAESTGKLGITAEGLGEDAIRAYEGPDPAGSKLLARGSPMIISVISGKSYQIALETDRRSGSTAVLSIETEPTNNSFANATLLESDATHQRLNLPPLWLGDREPGEPAHLGRRSGRSLWYKWTAPSYGPRLLRLLRPQNLSTFARGPVRLLCYEGRSLGTLLPLISGESNAPGKLVELRISAIAGTPYYFCIDSDLEVEATLQLTLDPAASNDAIENATPLRIGAYSVEIDARELAEDPIETAWIQPLFRAKLAWYVWRSDRPSRIDLPNPSPQDDNFFRPFVAFTTINGRSSYQTRFQPQILRYGGLWVPPNTTVYMAAMAFDSAKAPATKILQIRHSAANDERGEAVGVSEGNSLASTLYAAPTYQVLGAPSWNDVWYKYSQPNLEDLEVTIDSDLGPEVRLFPGSAGLYGLTPPSPRPSFAHAIWDARSSGAYGREFPFAVASQTPASEINMRVVARPYRTLALLPDSGIEFRSTSADEGWDILGDPAGGPTFYPRVHTNRLESRLIITNHSAFDRLITFQSRFVLPGTLSEYMDYPYNSWETNSLMSLLIPAHGIKNLSHRCWDLVPSQVAFYLHLTQDEPYQRQPIRWSMVSALNGELALEIRGDPYLRLQVESSKDLKNWEFYSLGYGPLQIPLPTFRRTQLFYRSRRRD